LGRKYGHNGRDQSDIYTLTVITLINAVITNSGLEGRLHLKESTTEMICDKFNRNYVIVIGWVRVYNQIYSRQFGHGVEL
jgi:hypothetical protein